ncbi:hypothetical protein B1H29_14350 [Streptomyces pactum]|uniref:Uncharacterized protein n=1 Tax=Streptomyces pactum TaxID=68249 RepID=A0A1S6J855_9ACTN|nr:hypothetical protein B1H29_14350 [Streptomyces pactum]
MAVRPPGTAPRHCATAQSFLTYLLLVQTGRAVLCKCNNVDHDPTRCDAPRDARSVPGYRADDGRIGTGGRSSARMGA